MERKVETVRRAATADEPDMIFLQMQLQGTLSLQVNAGPLEYAKTFCASKSSYDPAKVKVRCTGRHLRAVARAGASFPLPPFQQCLTPCHGLPPRSHIWLHHRR